MKKVYILAATKQVNAALTKLRQLGLVHVEHINQPAGVSIQHLEERLEEIEEALEVCPAELNSNKQCLLVDDAAIDSKANRAVHLYLEQKKISARRAELERISAWHKDWGDLSQGQLEGLKKQGINIKLYLLDKARFKRLTTQGCLQILKEKEGQVYLALVAYPDEEKLDINPVEVPELSVSEVNAEQNILTQREEEIVAEQKELASYRECWIKQQQKLHKEKEFALVLAGMAQEQEFAYLSGFCPRPQVEQLTQIATEQGWGIIVDQPSDDEAVPTLLKNPRWLKIINPVFKMMGTLPGYRERDISFWFLVFFSLFFAILIGDAGYGAIFLISINLLKRKFKNIPSDIFFLVNLLSGATLIWGALSGNWFGFEKIAQLPVLNVLVIEQINAFVDSNQMFVMYLCLFIGAVHLTLARALNVVNLINSPKALAEIGWVLILWAMFFLAGQFVLGKVMPDFVPTILLVGTGLIAVFTNFQRNIFKGILLTLVELPLKIIGSFSDVISYLRLFAVGYASTVIAASFNQMALGSVDNVFKALLAALALFLGHTLNIVLGAMAVIVHGVRLNMLEFSGHLGMEWSGREYQPFRE